MLSIYDHYCTFPKFKIILIQKEEKISFHDILLNIHPSIHPHNQKKEKMSFYGNMADCYSNDPADYFNPKDNGVQGEQRFVTCQQVRAARTGAALFLFIGVIGLIIYLSGSTYQKSWIVGGLIVGGTVLLTVGGYYAGKHFGRSSAEFKFRQLRAQWDQNKDTYKDDFLSFKKERNSHRMADAMQSNADATWANTYNGFTGRRRGWF